MEDRKDDDGEIKEKKKMGVWIKRQENESKIGSKGL
jgi:hypothetical protein